MNRLTIVLAAALLALAVLCGGQETPSAAERGVYDDLGLDDATVSRLMETGLVVLPRETILTREHGELTVGLRSVPMYVTPDIMLSLWHAASREAVGAIELHWLLPRLNDLCRGLLAATTRLRAEADEPSVERNAFVLEVACSLLDDAHVPSVDLADRVRSEVGRVHEHVRTDEATGVDYTVYTPPARHVDRPALCSYFAAARYLELHPAGLETDPQDAGLLALALQSDPGLAGLYREVVAMRAYLYGPAEEANLDELSAAMGPAWTRANPGDAAAVHAALKGRDVAVVPASGAPEAALLRSGGQPTGLQVAAALGSELAAATLRGQGLEAPAANAALPSEGLPAATLNLLRTLFSDPGRAAPAGAAVSAQRQLNCCLSAWVVGRSDADLACPDCDGPSYGAPVGGLVEPLPEFFSAYAALCRDLQAKLVQLETAPKVALRVARLAHKADVFSRCAEDQLAERDTSWAADEIAQFGEWVKGAWYGSVPVLTKVAATDGQADHLGTGWPHRALVRYRRDGEWQLAMGWVGSYYEVAAGPSSLSPPQWEARLAADYAAPQAPGYLSAICPPRGVSAQAEQLRRIEDLLLSGNTEAGMRAFEVFIAAERDTPWAPQAVLTAGKCLDRVGRSAEAAEVFQRAGSMYGCDARAEALVRTKWAAWASRSQEDRAAQEDDLQRALAATAPRPGLSAEQDLERQNQRALVLLQHARVSGPEAAEMRRLASRVIDECPRSGYVPYAELGLAILPLERGQGSAPDVYEARRDLLAVADEYGGSAIGRAASLVAARALYALGDLAGAEAEARSLAAPGYVAPEPEPYPESVRLLADGTYGGLHGATALDVSELLHLVGREVVEEACRTGDLERLQSWHELEVAHAPDYTGDLAPELAAYLDYLADAPEVLRAVLPLLPPFGGDTIENLPPFADGPALTARLLQVAQPPTAARPAAAVLHLLWLLAHRLDAANAARLRADAARTLAQRYPDSLEHLIARCTEAIAAEDALTVRKCCIRLHGIKDPYGETLVSHLPAIPGWVWGRMPERADEWRRRFGDLLRAAEVGDRDIMRCGSEERLVGLLIARLPEQELRIIAAMGDGYSRQALGTAALERRPDGDGADELRLKLGTPESLAQIVARGPQTPCFAEAVEAFEVTRPITEVSSRRDLAQYRRLAREHAGTPAEVLALVGVARTHLQYEQPEAAIVFIDETLATVPPDRMFRDRLPRLRGEAERQIAMKRAGSVAPALEFALPPTFDPRLWAQDALGTHYLLAQQYGQPAELLSFGPDTGAVRWRASVPDALSLLTAADKVVVSTGVGTVLGLSAATGRVEWQTPLGLSQIGSTWVAGDGSALVAYWDQGSVAALDPSSGRVLWTRDALLSPSGLGTPLRVAGGLVCGWDHTLTLRAWRMDNGEEVWSVPLGQLSTDPDLRLGLSTGNCPVWTVCGDAVVVSTGAKSLELTALDLKSGKQRWRKELPDQAQLAADESRQAGAIILQGYATVGERDVREAGLRWTASLPAEPRGLAVSDRHLAVSAGDAVLVVDRRTGQVVARPTPGPDVRAMRLQEGPDRLEILRPGALLTYDLPAREG